MATYRWSELRDKFTRDTGGSTPGAQLEQDIIVLFRDHPRVVAESMKHVRTAHKNGKVVSAWPVLKIQIEREISTEHVVADDSSEKQHAIRRAENWIKNCGIHYDRVTEIRADLFDRGGILESWAEDEPLAARMTQLWREHRPAGEAIEAADHEADAKFAEAHACAKCGKLRPFLLAPCPHCQHDARMAAMLDQLGPQPDPDEEPL